MSKFFGKKRFSLLAALSAVVIIAGVILYALLGFNTALDVPSSKTAEIEYNVVTITQQEEALQKICEDAFRSAGLSFSEKEVRKNLDSTSFAESNDRTLVYTFGDVSDETLRSACDAINTSVGVDATYKDAYVFASAHTLQAKSFYEPAWRGAIALAVGAIVALIYVCIRFGVSCAVAGLCCAAHDALFTAAFFAITRIPVFGAGPLLYAAVAAFLSLLLWTLLCGKMKDDFKAAGTSPSEEVIRNAAASSKKKILFAAGIFAGVVVILGAVAASGASLLLLPAVVGVFVPVYSTLFLGPEICIPIRKAFDKRRERAKKKGAYSGKQKADAAEAK